VCLCVRVLCGYVFVCFSVCVFLGLWISNLLSLDVRCCVCVFSHVYLCVCVYVFLMLFLCAYL